VRRTLPGLTCAHCAYESDLVTSLFTSKPESGSAGICVNCALINVLQDDGTFRQPNLDEELRITADPVMVRIRAVILKAQTRKRKKRASRMKGDT
jgi:hypothetical protein